MQTQIDEMFHFYAAAMHDDGRLQPPPDVARWRVECSEMVRGLTAKPNYFKLGLLHYILDNPCSIIDTSISTPGSTHMKFRSEKPDKTSPLDRGNIIFRPCSWMRLPNNIQVPDDDRQADALHARNRYDRSVSSPTERRCTSSCSRARAESEWPSEPLSEASARFEFPYTDGPGYGHPQWETPSSTNEETASDLTAAGLCLLKGGDFHAAERKYRAAAAQGDLVALHNLGTMYLHGQGVSKDYTVAYGCFRRCSELGMAPSMSQLGYMYLHGHGVRKNASEAFSWFSKAATAGRRDGSDTYTNFHLGMMYIMGVGVAKDIIRGCEWLKISAHGDFAPALYNLAIIYMNGLGEVQKNIPLAASFLTRAAALRDPYAQNNLAILYARGVVVKQDYNKAYLLFRMAAKHGVSAAMFNLGEMYNNGLGIGPDSTKAARYYLRAATTTENAEAEFNLACLFLSGKGTIKQDLELSLHWFEKAAAHGHKGARNNATVLLSPRFNVKPPVRATDTPTKPILKPARPGSTTSESQPRKVKSRASVRFSFIRLFS